MSASSSGYQEDIARALKSNAEIKELLSKPRASLGGKTPSTAASASPETAAQAPIAKPSPMAGGVHESEAVNQLKSTIEGLLRDLGRALMEKQKIEVGIRNHASHLHAHGLIPYFYGHQYRYARYRQCYGRPFLFALAFSRSKQQTSMYLTRKRLQEAQPHVCLSFVRALQSECQLLQKKVSMLQTANYLRSATEEAASADAEHIRKELAMVLEVCIPTTTYAYHNFASND
jgi:hypothetical protein